MNKILVSLILAAASSLAIAGEAQPPTWQQMFEQLKSIESRSHLGRIQILQEAEACIQAATTPEAYRTCEQKEAQARQQLKEELRPLHESLREQTKQHRQPCPAEAAAPRT